jgi:uncharacterized protein YydD (DUF2326 family)
VSKFLKSNETFVERTTIVDEKLTYPDDKKSEMKKKIQTVQNRITEVNERRTCHQLCEEPKEFQELHANLYIELVQLERQLSDLYL